MYILTLAASFSCSCSAQVFLSVDWSSLDLYQALLCAFIQLNIDLAGSGEKLGEIVKISPLTVTNPPRIPWKSNLIGDNFSGGGEECQTGKITHFTKEFNLSHSGK